MSKKILVVDDMKELRTLLKQYLTQEGFEVATANNGQEALFIARQEKPDLIILDLMMPEMGGYEFIKAYNREANTPIIILTAKLEESEKVLGLELGADDYITKPFSAGELLARMRVCLRRCGQTEESPVISCGELTIDILKHRVCRGAEEVKLTPTEYEIVKLLAQNAGRVLTHKQLLKAVWGSAYSDTHYIRVYIGQIRRKIEEDPTNPHYIMTEPGIGYRFMGD